MPDPKTPQNQPSATRPVTRELIKKNSSGATDASGTPSRHETQKPDKADKKSESKTDDTREPVKERKGVKEPEGAEEVESSKTGIEVQFDKFKDEIKSMFAGMLEDSEARETKILSKQINSLESNFKASVDSMRKELNTEIADVKKEIEQTKSEVKSASASINNVTKSVRKVSDKVEDLQESLDFQENQMKDMDKAQDSKRGSRGFN